MHFKGWPTSFGATILLKTEQSYCARLRRYCGYVKEFPAHLSSEQKLERFLTALAKQEVAASTQNKL